MLDRQLQRRILELLAENYPDGVYELPETMGITTEPEEIALLFNSRYLHEHGLITSGYERIGGLEDDGGYEDTGLHCITARGLDFLQADGGLSAILGVVTVRLDAAQWADLLASKIEKLEGVSQEERSSIAKALRSLPAKAIEKVSEKMLGWAVDHAQDALPLLRTLLDQVGA